MAGAGDNADLCTFRRPLTRCATSWPSGTDVSPGDHIPSRGAQCLTAQSSENWSPLLVGNGVCDVANHALIDVPATRDFAQVASWLRRQPPHVKERLEYGCLDMSRTYNAVFRVVTPKATPVIDRFHVMRHAIFALVLL